MLSVSRVLSVVEYDTSTTRPSCTFAVTETEPYFRSAAFVNNRVTIASALLRFIFVFPFVPVQQAKHQALISGKEFAF